MKLLGLGTLLFVVGIVGIVQLVDGPLRLAALALQILGGILMITAAIRRIQTQGGTP